MQEQETIQQKDERFMRRALQEAEAARDAGEIPVGAVIVAGDRIIARGIRSARSRLALDSAVLAYR